AIRLERPAGVLAGTLRVEPGLSFAVEGLDGTVQKRGESFDAAALTRWLADAGVSADGATVTGLYDAARAVIENPSKHPTAGPGMRAAGGGSASMLVVPRWYWWVVFVVLAGVWAVGCFLLFMR